MTCHRYFNKRPFVIAALGMMAGLLFSYRFPGMPGYLICGGALLCAAMLRVFRIRGIALFLLFLSLGALRLQLAYPAFPAERSACTLTGAVSQAFPKAYGTQLRLTNARVDGHAIDGDVLITLPPQNGPAPSYGSRLHVEASLSLPQGPRNEGGMDYRSYCLSQGIVALAKAKGTVSIVEAPIGFYGKLLVLRDTSTQILIKLMGQENGALAAGMLHGAVADIPEETLDAFRVSGIAHLLSVSGLHVSLLAGMLLLLLRRVRPVPQLIMICAALLFYCAFCAFAPATLRAALMTFCLLFSRVCNRRNDPLSALSFSFLLLVLISPFALFSVGFQLSYAAVLGILLLYPTLNGSIQRLPRTLKEPLALSISAGVSTLPVSAAVFQTMPILSIPANILVVPLCALSMLPSGIALLLYPLSPAIARFLASISGATLSLMRAVAQAAAAPGMLWLPTFSLGAGVCFFLFLLFCSPYFLGKRKERILLASVSAALSIALVAVPLSLRPQRHITVLDTPYGYAVHVHEAGSDKLFGTKNALTGAAAERYLYANGISHAERMVADAKGMRVTLEGYAFFVSPGSITAVSGTYHTNRHGQIRFYVRNGQLSMQPYARDSRYAILIEKP